jgi:hypothetical protein
MLKTFGTERLAYGTGPLIPSLRALVIANRDVNGATGPTIPLIAETMCSLGTQYQEPDVLAQQSQYLGHFQNCVPQCSNSSSSVDG